MTDGSSNTNKILSTSMALKFIQFCSFTIIPNIWYNSNLFLLNVYNLNKRKLLLKEMKTRFCNRKYPHIKSLFNGLKNILYKSIKDTFKGMIFRLNGFNQIEENL